MAGATQGPEYQTAAGAWQGEAMSPELMQYAREWMANPNRYTTPAMQAKMQSIDAASDRGRREGMRSIEELMARRGTLGSSVEWVEGAGLEDRLDENRLQQYADLLERMAYVEAQDRSAAGGFGLDTGRFGQSLGQDRREEGRYGHETDRQRGRDYEEDLRTRDESGFRNAEFGEGAQMDRYRLGQQESQFGRDLDVRQQEAENERLQQQWYQDLELLKYWENNPEVGQAARGNPKPAEPPEGKSWEDGGYWLSDAGEWQWGDNFTDW